MPIHLISDNGGGLYVSGATPGNWPTNAKRVFISVGPGAWVEIAQGWRLASANYITGSANWVQSFATNKYAPTVPVAACSATAPLTPGRPATVHWTEATGGTGLTLAILPKNITQATQDTLITLPGPRSGGTGSQLYTIPAGWNSGDDVAFTLYYIDGNGYGGPQTTTNTITLP